DGLPMWRPKSANAQMASLLEKSRARVRREAGASESRPRTGPGAGAGAGAARRTDRQSAAQRETLRLEHEAKESVRQEGRAASLRAMLRFAIPPNRPTLKEVLGMTDDEYAAALRYGSGFEVPRPHRYHRMLSRPGGDAGPGHRRGDRLCQLFAECASWMRCELSQDPGADKDIQPHRLCQPLVLEREEGARLAVDVQEMRTVSFKFKKKIRKIQI
ncbi:ATP-dependent DNA helicase RecQ, partial [Frankliniella fusca]